MTFKMFTISRFYTLPLFLMVSFYSFSNDLNQDGDQYGNEEENLGEPVNPPIEGPIDENLYWLLLLGLFFAFKFFIRHQRGLRNTK